MISNGKDLALVQDAAGVSPEMRNIGISVKREWLKVVWKA